MNRHIGLLFVDLTAVALSTVGALVVRENGLSTLNSLRDLGPYVAISVTVALLLFPLFGLNRTIWRFSTINDLFAVLLSCFAVVLSSIAIGFAVNRLDGVARTLPIIQGMLMVFLMAGVRLFARERERRRSADNRNYFEVDGNTTREVAVVVGIDGMTEVFLRFIAEHLADRITIAGLVGRSDQHTGRLVHQHKILGKPEEIATIISTLEVHGLIVDRIYVTAEFESLSGTARESLLQVERNSRVRIVSIADQLFKLIEESVVAKEPTRASAMPSEVAFVLTEEQREAVLSRPYWKLKRVFDIVGALALILLTAPLQIIVAFLVMIDVGLPVAFFQHRPGLNGRLIKLYKLRTMRSGIRPDGRRIPDDERMSGFGRFLRRARLDEFPQLIHILRGDMSLVGPRPLLPIDQPMESAPRLLVRPGLTGYAQVKGGRMISAEDKITLDVWYVLNASLLLDIKLLLATVPMLLKGEVLDAAAVEQARRELVEQGILRVADSAKAPDASGAVVHLDDTRSEVDIVQAHDMPSPDVELKNGTTAASVGIAERLERVSNGTRP